MVDLQMEISLLGRRIVSREGVLTLILTATTLTLTLVEDQETWVATRKTMFP